MNRFLKKRKLTDIGDVNLIDDNLNIEINIKELSSIR